VKIPSCLCKAKSRNWQPWGIRIAIGTTFFVPTHSIARNLEREIILRTSIRCWAWRDLTAPRASFGCFEYIWGGCLKQPVDNIQVQVCHNREAHSASSRYERSQRRNVRREKTNNLFADWFSLHKRFTATRNPASINPDLSKAVWILYVKVRWHKLIPLISDIFFWDKIWDMFIKLVSSSFLKRNAEINFPLAKGGGHSIAPKT